MKPNNRGDLIIPGTVLRRLGFGGAKNFEVVGRGEEIIVRPTAEGGEREFEALSPQEREMVFDDWLKKYAGSADGGLTTDEVMRMTRGED
jgi:bifunctional DNA-binding transcriptional regulator/antitoxin component of YhaV-PrlF toxin-antitoxin module